MTATHVDVSPLDTMVTVHEATNQMVVKALSYARMSNHRKADGDHSNYFEEKFIDTVDCIATVLGAAFGRSPSYEVYTARRRELENLLGDAADDPNVWTQTGQIMFDLVRTWRS